MIDDTEGHLANDLQWDDSSPKWYPTAAEQFGWRMRASRTHAEPSLRALADKTGISKSVLGRIERGTVSPNGDTAQTLDEALHAQGALALLGLATRAEPYLNLPPAPFFLGRRRELIKLTDLVCSHRPRVAPTAIFIAGTAGVGKTALALIPAGEHQRTSLLRDQLRLRAQRVLVVLDNAVDSHQDLPILPALPACTVLVTSRVQLSELVIEASASAVPLDMMDPAGAAHLVEVLIGEGRVDSERDMVAQLVDLCGALPLAVIVAAERTAAAPDRTVASHVAEMADLVRRMQLLDVDEDGDSIGVCARAFGVHGAAIPEFVDERAELHRSKLAGHRVLVVLDDAADDPQLRLLLDSPAAVSSQ